MAQYIDGFVIPIARDKVEAYQHIAARAGAIWKEHGALAYWEGVGEDMDIEEMVAFPAMANAQDGETVIFAFIAYESREHRDKVNAAVMADPRLNDMTPEEHPFDYRRMAYGGFKALVDL